MNTENTAARIRDFCRHFVHIHLHDVGGVHDPKLLLKKGEVTWIGKNGDWMRPFWFELYPYHGQFVRLTTNRVFPISKARWPFPAPSSGGIRPLKLTFDASEFEVDLSDLIYKMMTLEMWWFESDFFDENAKVPTSAWSIRAKEARSKLI